MAVDEVELLGLVEHLRQLHQWGASGSPTPSSSRSARGTGQTSDAAVRESPLAKSVTSWPRRTCSSTRYETTRSVPP